MIKIDKSYLHTLTSSIPVENMLGSWVGRIDDIRENFQKAKPFESVVIDDFLQPEYAHQLSELFPENFKDWYHYDNPIEKKYAFDNIESLSVPLKNYFYFMSSPFMVQLFSNISGIQNIEYDEYLHGAGLHAHPRHGRLQIHLDYEKHPHSGKERRLNVILFLSKDWKEEWNGHNELWNQDLSECQRKTAVQFNRAILFKTNDISYHGVPEEIQCPENVFRKSLAYYYVSPLSSEMMHKKEYRKKATFFQTKKEPYDERLQRLFKIRSQRLLTPADWS
jgi:Rps23 Pro-64 3,4-dihydroxylase Tpa1-like proline 4-hydroxylase